MLTEEQIKELNKLTSNASKEDIDILKNIFSIIDFTNNNQFSIDDEINLNLCVSNILKSLHCKTNLKGYHYLRIAIIMTVKDFECVTSITKLLYPIIAKQYNVLSSNVERGIRHTIESSFPLVDNEKLEKYSLYRNQNSKPTNSEYIATIADYINLNYIKRNQKTK